MRFKQFDINFDRFTYIVEDTGIRLIIRRLSSSTETFVDFESIGSKIIRENTRKSRWLFISVFFILITIALFVYRHSGGSVEEGAELIYLSISATFAFVFVFTGKNKVFLAQSDNTNAIEFIGKKRDKEKLTVFIKQLLQCRDSYLINKYTTFDKYIPYDQQYKYLIWLYSEKLLTADILKEKIVELDSCFKDGNQKRDDFAKVVGFKNNDSDPRQVKEKGEEFE